jgi:hypothetical protein
MHIHGENWRLIHISHRVCGINKGHTVCPLLKGRFEEVCWSVVQCFALGREQVSWLLLGRDYVEGDKQKRFDALRHPSVGDRAGTLHLKARIFS